MQRVFQIFWITGALVILVVLGSVFMSPDRVRDPATVAYATYGDIKDWDPAEYWYSSFGRAMGGNREARRGYERVFCLSGRWKHVLPSYNLILYGKGSLSKGVDGKDHGRIDPETVRRVLENKGKLPLSDVIIFSRKKFTCSPEASLYLIENKYDVVLLAVA